MSALKPSPTEQSYGELLKAYDVFNEQLFGGQLPGALVTLTRKKRTCGYYSAGRFGSSDGRRARCDEIAMNPQFFGTQPIEEVMATLVHEMAHQWQFHFGKDQPRGRYHNNEWATKMEAIGLVPSDTGRPGGRRTGDQMSDYIDPRGGKFQDACAMLVTQDFRLTWYDRYVDEAHRPPASISEGSSSSNLAFLTTRFVVGSDVEDDEPSDVEEGGNDDNASMLAALLGCPPPGALDFADVKHVAGEVPNSNRVKYKLQLWQQRLGTSGIEDYVRGVQFVVRTGRRGWARSRRRRREAPCAAACSAPAWQERERMRARRRELSRMAEMGNASVSNVAVNAADTLLAIFSALRESNMSNTVAQALAIAMPFANDPLDRKDQLAEARRHSDATLRLYILVRTLRELRETALSNRAVERTVATRALDEAASFLSAAPRQLDGSGSWLAGTISERMLDAFRVMSHALPKDRHQVPANARQELVVALAGLRAVAAEPGTDAALRAAIQRIIATLEEAIIASYAEGQSSLVDIMVRWKRQHDGFEATFDALPVKDDGAVAVRRAYADVAKAVVNCMRGIADDVLRVAGIVQIASTLNNSIPTNF